MTFNTVNLYPQYNQNQDRRKQNISVDVEQRSNTDRRQNRRYSIDDNLSGDLKKTKEIFAPFLNKRQNNQVNNHPVFKKAFLTALSPIVPVRRIASLPDNIEDKNYARATGLVGLMMFNLPEDCRDIRNSIRQISDKILSAKTKEKLSETHPKFYKTFIEYKKPYDYTKFQHPFSFFRGTWLEPLLKYEGKYSRKISNILYRADKPFSDTTFGQNILKIFKIDDKIAIPSGIYDTYNDLILARLLKGGNKITRSIVQGTIRMPILGIYVLSLLELPAIIKSFKKSETTEEKIQNITKQTAKSAVFVTCMTSMIGIIGGIGFKKFGATGSLIGMGAGSVIGGIISKKTGDLIDKS